MPCSLRLYPGTGMEPLTLPALAILLMLMLMLAAASGCTPSQEVTMDRAQQAALSDTLLALAQDMDVAWRTEGAEAFLAHFSDDSYYYWRGLGMPKSVFREVFAREMGEGTEEKTSLINPQVRVLGHGAALVSFEFRGSATGTDGETLEDVAKAVSFVFRRDGDAWKVVLAHESGPPPPM